jgi:tetratricopeptide (TPR) repeat protein
VAWWQRGQISRRDFYRSLPFFGLALVFGLVTIWFQYYRAIGDEVIHTRNFWVRLISAGWAVWFYLGKAIWPSALSFIYTEWTVTPSALLGWLPGAGLSAVLFLLWRGRKTWGRPWLFALAYFVVVLFPVLGFFKIYFQKFSFVADHWQYFALPAATALFAAAFRWRGKEDHTEKKGAGKLKPSIHGAATFIVALGLVVILMVLTFQRAKIFHNEETVWRDTLKKNPRCWVALNNLAVFLKRTGRYDEAIDVNRQSLEIRPKQVEAHHHLGVLFHQRGKTAEALEQYNAALAVDPGHIDTRVNKGVILNELGRRAEAIQELLQAVQRNPAHPEAQNNLGGLLLLDGQYDEAIVHLREALKYKADLWDAMSNLGSALVKQGKSGEAADYLRKAIAIHPSDPIAHLNLGDALLNTGKTAEAMAEYNVTLRLQPDLTAAHVKAGTACLRMNNLNEASAHFSAALKQEPNSADVHYQLALVSVAQSNKRAALGYLRQAIELKPDWVDALNNLAWTLATDGKASIRDGPEAVRFARRAAEIAGNNDPITLDTLAAAYAEADQFSQAVEFSEKARRLALSSGQTNLAAQIQLRLELYRNGRPYHER